MNFEHTERGRDFQERVGAFMDEFVYPAEPVYRQQMDEAPDPHFQPPIIEELKVEAQNRGLWNLFHPHTEWGPGLTNLEYSPLAELSLPFGNAACTGQSGVETVIPLRAAASDASLKL